MKTRIPFLTLSAAVCLACGGGGSDFDSRAPVVKLTASATTIRHGDSVEITYASENLASGEASFPLIGSDMFGSFTDRPGCDTTYTYIGRGKGGAVTATLTVRVEPSDARIRLVAGANDSSAQALKQHIQSLTTEPVTISQTVPSVQEADVVVLAESAQVGTPDAARVRAFVQPGKSAVLIGRTPRRIATGDPANPNIEALSPWFAGALRCSDFNRNLEITDNPESFPLSADYTFDKVFCAYDVGPIKPEAIALFVDGNFSDYPGFAYKSPSGGKVGYLTGVSVGTRPEDRTMRMVFLSLVRWAAAP